MPESFDSKKMRWMFNLFPAYWGSGATVTYIDATYKELRVKLPLSWRTRNYVGTIYGGSMYASIDPMYMLMLMRILGKEFVVWDKAANIRFRRPGQTTLYANFIITDEQVAEIMRQVKENGQTDYIFDLDMVDKDGKVHVQFEKTIYIADKAFYKNKRSKK